MSPTRGGRCSGGQQHHRVRRPRIGRGRAAFMLSPRTSRPNAPSGKTAPRATATVRAGPLRGDPVAGLRPAGGQLPEDRQADRGDVAQDRLPAFRTPQKSALLLAPGGRVARGRRRRSLRRPGEFPLSLGDPALDLAPVALRGGDGPPAAGGAGRAASAGAGRRPGPAGAASRSSHRPVGAPLGLGQPVEHGRVGRMLPVAIVVQHRARDFQDGGDFRPGFPGHGPQPFHPFVKFC